MGKNLSEMTLEELWALFPIVLTPPDPRWADWYREEAALIQAVLPPDLPLRLTHIGSTAIPGIYAKPIVDILAEAAQDADLSRADACFARAGYRLMAADPDRRSYNKGYTGEGFAEKVFHLHLCRRGVHDEVIFRDYLRAHPEAAREYEALKLSLWMPFEHDRDGYTEAKGGFIREILLRAAEEDT